MLPEVLSNGVCSLKPGEDRWAMVAEFVLTPDGQFLEEQFYEALICSKARLTYHRVFQILVDKDPFCRGAATDYLDSLETLSAAATLLRQLRMERGAVDFDLPEPDIILDLTGGVENIVRSKRNWSHQIIEELMIAANERVATFLTKTKFPCIYRVHEPPPADKIQNFWQVVQILGYSGSWGGRKNRAPLRPVIEFFDKTPASRMVNTLLVRSMSQAIYSPQNIGHFGLASACYCHFTSPIRRYPDLIVHRYLKMAAAAQHLKMVERESRQLVLEEQAERCSRQERKAMEAEREILRLHSAIFMQDKVGESFKGIVSHLGKWGVMVELQDYFVEGVVALEMLPPDRYRWEESRMKLVGKRGGYSFGVGTEMEVRLDQVDIATRKLHFVWESGGILA